LVKPGTPQGAIRLKIWALAFQIVARGARGAPRDVRESARHLFSVLTVPVIGRPPALFAALVAEAEHDFMRAQIERRLRIAQRRRVPLAMWTP
jgi:hypothetical protein